MALRGTSTETVNSNGSVTILAIEPDDMVAPAGIWFEAVNISGMDVSTPATRREYDPTTHDIDWEWDFDDAGTFNNTELNIPDEWNEKGKAYKKKAYHVFDTPGTYTVTLTGRDKSGTICTNTYQAVIQNADDVYTGTRTICVSTSGTFTGAPSGSQQFTTIAAARTAYNALGSSTPGRILLRSGETFVGNLDIDDNVPNCHVDIFGGSAKAIWAKPDASTQRSGSLYAISWGSNNFATDSKVANIEFRGDWDPDTETGDGRFQPFGLVTHNGANSNGNTCCFYNCKFTGISAVNLQQGNNEFTTGLVDCEVERYQDYGIANFGTDYNDNSRIALVGCSSHQSSDACDNQTGKSEGSMSNNHGPQRDSDTLNYIIDVCSFFSNNSWGTGVQPALRLCSNTLDSEAEMGNVSYWASITRSHMEGAGGADGQNGGALEAPMNIVFDMCIFTRVWSGLRMFEGGHSGITIRNTLWHNWDITSEQSQMLDFIAFDQDNPGFGNASGVFNVYNTTVVNWKSASVTFVDGAEISTEDLDNNIVYLNSSETGDDPLNTTETFSGMTLLNQGRRDSCERVSGTMSSVSNGGTLAVNLPSGTTDSDFTGATRATLKVQSNYYFQHEGDFTVTFNGNGTATFTNTSGETWSAGSYDHHLHQTNLTTNSAFGAGRSTVPTMRPQTGSAAIGAADTGNIAYRDLLGNIRGSNPSRGALEPA